MEAPQCYVICALPGLFNKYFFDILFGLELVMLVGTDVAFTG